MDELSIMSRVVKPHDGGFMATRESKRVNSSMCLAGILVTTSAIPSYSKGNTVTLSPGRTSSYLVNTQQHIILQACDFNAHGIG